MAAEAGVEKTKVGRSRAVNYASLVSADMAMAFLWVFLNAVARFVVDVGLTFLDEGSRQHLKKGFVIALLFLFYWLSKVFNGATYNPLTVIAYAVAGITHHPLSVLSLRLPAQIIGASVGAFAAILCLPERYQPMISRPYLRVDPHVGAFAEGTLTFAVVLITLVASLRGPSSEIRKTWITSISRVSLSILGADYTGAAMNPANAFGWAFMKNQYQSWEHLYVYWITPFFGTLAAAWLVRAMLGSSTTVKEKTS